MQAGDAERRRGKPTHRLQRSATAVDRAGAAACLPTPIARQVKNSRTARAIPGTTAHITSTLPFARGSSGRTAGSPRAASTERTINTYATRQLATEIQNRMVAGRCGILMTLWGKLESSR